MRRRPRRPAVARRALGGGVLLCGALLVGGCYSYAPPAGPLPVAGTSIALDLNDQGRLGMGALLGPGVRRISGRLVGASDSVYALSVTDIETLRGERTNWTGERLEVRRDFVGELLERKLSRSRTALAAGTALAVVGTYVATRTLGGSGNPDNGGGGTNPPPGQTTRVLPPRGP